MALSKYHRPGIGHLLGWLQVKVNTPPPLPTRKPKEFALKALELSALSGAKFKHASQPKVAAEALVMLPAFQALGA